MEHSDAKSKKTWPGKLIIFVVNFLLGLYFFKIAYESKKAYQDIQTWVETEAIVTNHSVYEQPKASKSTIRERWTPVWTYQYKINHQQYTSQSRSFSHVVLSTFKSSPAAAQRELNKHPLQSEIKIFYNPENPQETIIEKWPPNTAKDTTFIILGIAVTLMGLLVPWIVDKQNTRKP